jgi:excisionase family DNA binding protein
MSEERLLTIEEVAERLQYAVQWVRDMVNAGKIPAIQINQRDVRYVNLRNTRAKPVTASPS